MAAQSISDQVTVMQKTLEAASGLLQMYRELYSPLYYKQEILKRGPQRLLQFVNDECNYKMGLSMMKNCCPKNFPAPRNITFTSLEDVRDNDVIQVLKIHRKKEEEKKKRHLEQRATEDAKKLRLEILELTEGVNWDNEEYVDCTPPNPQTTASSSHPKPELLTPLSLPDEDQGTLSPPDEVQGHPKPDILTPLSLPDEDQGTLSLPDEDQGALSLPDEDQGTLSLPDEDQGTISLPHEDQGTTSLPDDGQATLSLPHEDQRNLSLPD